MSSQHHAAIGDRAAASSGGTHPARQGTGPAVVTASGTVTAYADTAARSGRLSLYDLQRPEVLADPWPWYRSLLAADGPYWDPTVRSWLVSRHADVSRLLTDRRLSVAMDHQLVARVAPAATRHWYPLLDAHVSFVDPPRHTGLRSVLAVPFKPAVVSALELDGYVADVVEAALDRVAGAGRMDVVTDLAYRIPLQVMRHILGLDGVDLPTLRRWSNAWGEVVAAPAHLPTGDTGQLVADVNDLIGFLRETVAEHRASPRDTVTGLLVRGAADGLLTEDEVIAGLMMLVTAGHETTANLISNIVAALIDDPQLANLLRRTPCRLPTAVNELARLYAPTQYTARTASVDIEIGARPIPAGSSVVLMLAAANRDPAAFPNPGAVLLDRPAAPQHVTFGHGPHFCFGAPLARLEARLTLRRLLTRCGDLQPAGERRWRPNANLRGLDTLPIRFRPYRTAEGGTR